MYLEHGADIGGDANKLASDAFNVEGIKGIRYDDGFSRGKEGGTKNFVVFDDSLITIAEKNGIPMQQVEELAQAQGIPKQQALATLIGGTGGIALMGGSERAEAQGIEQPQQGMQPLGGVVEQTQETIANRQPQDFSEVQQRSAQRQKEMLDKFSLKRLGRKGLGTAEVLGTVGSGLASEDCNTRS